LTKLYNKNIFGARLIIKGKFEVDTITVRVPTHIKEKLLEMANKDSRGLSNYLLLILTNHVINKDKK